MLVENQIALIGSLPPWTLESPPSNPRRSLGRRFARRQIADIQETVALFPNGGRIPRPGRARHPPGALRPFQPDRHGPPVRQPWRRQSGRVGRKRQIANVDELHERAGHAGSQPRGDDPQARGLARRHGRPRGGVDPRRPGAASTGTVVPAPIEKACRKVEPETVVDNMKRNLKKLTQIKTGLRGQYASARP